ncbi:murein biosynthesis integral membrane protein MurJ [Sphingomonas sp. AP4-R1]|uniref:murein biosynthesis integral membrane protein MurJ n=1 Tax=Sphingomonas sp. AP4-R1 TaxID=2735134 RepID=UPI00149372A9|nr:murein biosynthesis integral membrane protein MurJ [Sphingomonas sp. AP4-R1]QJU58925.1 murein biosynthesis integral membrane protein MurJ [Sphingomonas sp. AP4-R1]
MSLVRNTATIGGLTLISRIAGFVRDMLMAQFVGAGFANDAFLIAWRLPNLFRALFAEGAFASAFVPMFNREVGREDGGLPAALDFAEQVLAILFPILLVFTILMMAATAPIVWAMTGGFPDGGPDKFALAVSLTRITFPYLALISLVSLLGGILNSVDRFWVNAAAPILLNICMIVGLVFFRGATPLETAYTQAISVTVSGVAQLAWLMWACARAGTSLRLRRPRINPKVRQLLHIIWPAALGAGAVQFNLLISTSLAARFLPQGAVSYLYYADRLNQLPLGLIGIGVGTAMLPGLSRQIAGGDAGGANTTQNRAIELSLVLTLPATAALMVAAFPIIQALLQHGAFTAGDTLASANALAAFSLGLPAYILIKVLVPGFHARTDTRTPVRIALVAMLANLIGNLILIWPLQHVGLALSTAISAWVNAGLLYATLHRRGHFRIDERLKRALIRLTLATVAMAAMLVAVSDWTTPHMTGPLVERALWLGGLMAAAGIVYFGAAIALGAFRPAELRAQLLRRRK